MLEKIKQIIAEQKKIPERALHKTPLETLFHLLNVRKKKGEETGTKEIGRL